MGSSFENLNQDYTCVTSPTRYVVVFPVRDTCSHALLRAVHHVLTEICEDVVHDSGYIWHKFRFTLPQGMAPATVACMVANILGESIGNVVVQKFQQ